MSAVDRKAANQEALAALKFARDLVNPKSDEAMLESARELQLQIVKVMRLLTPVAPIGSRVAISDQVQPDLEATMQNLAGVLHDILRPLGYALFVFEFGEDALFNYVSNAAREDMVATMKDFIAAHEGRALPAPVKDQ